MAARAKVYVLGVYTNPFGRHADKSHKDLTRQAYLGVLDDAGLESGADIASAWFGSTLMHYWGQELTRGNVCFTPLVRDGLFPGRAPVVNVEVGCTTGSVALLSAVREVKAGDADLSLAIGVEKLYDPRDPAAIFKHFGDAMDQLDPEEWQSHYESVASKIGETFAPAPDRTIAMDTYAMQALYHMDRYGTTAEQIAVGAAKNHCNGALNPNAQYRFAMTPEEVLADRVVTKPLTRSMCAPMGDGAAAVLVCSEEYLRRQSSEARARAIEIRGIGLTGGKYRELDEPGLTHEAARRAYRAAGVTSNDIDVAEVHDATSFAEIYQAEMLGFCEIGEGGPFVGSGATKLDGQLPINPSGGLVSRGHPIAASGLVMAHELVTQLRGEAGERQVRDAAIALQENGGGIIGLEEAAAAVTIFARPDA